MMDIITGIIELGILGQISFDAVTEKKKKVKILTEEIEKIGKKNED